MKKTFFIIIICLLMLTGCINTSVKQDSNTEENNVIVSEIKVIINDNIYILKLENNSTVKEFVSLLPQTFTLNDLNNNEKYVYMDKSLTANSYSPKHIEKGDVMLYGDDCLVIFYESFDTNYSYTKIGHIENLENLGNGSITVKFEK